MEYCDIVWSNADSTSLQRLLRLQKRGARIILQKKIREDRTANLYCELGWVSLLERWNFHKCLTSKRFRSVSEQRKTEEWDSQF